MTHYLWLTLPLVAALANAGQVQVDNLQLPSGAADRQQDVKNLFVTSYEAYDKYAWGHDDLLPVSKTYADDRNGWGASMVDALDTMWLMGFHDWFERAVNYTAEVDFSRSKTNDTVNLFETTIRYLGGLLSAYEISGQKYKPLLDKAEQVTRQMAYAWLGNNAVPYNAINFTTHAPVVDVTGIAAAGTLTLEWNRLSYYTKNDTYRQLAEKTVQHIMNMPAPLTGLPAQLLDPATGNPVDGYVTWGGGSDSYFEYLIKYARLTNNDTYADAWSTAADTSIKQLMRTSTVGDWVYLADYDDDKKIRHVGSHLACFYGGNWILGGKLLNNDDIFKIGLQLTDACWNTYASAATGIGPETFAYVSAEQNGNYTGGSQATQDQLDYYNEHGYYITMPSYIMRPEVLESNFYAWRATGDIKYFNNAVSATKSFQKYLPAGVAYGGINDVNSTTSSKIDDTPSFWFAETLKYLYLTFDEPSKISLDDYVFNTECHPFKAPDAKSVYGSGPGPHPVWTPPFVPQTPSGTSPPAPSSSSPVIPLASLTGLLNQVLGL